jgi:hypothetical protein
MDNAADAVMALSMFGAVAVVVHSIARVWIKQLDVRRDPGALDALDRKLTRIDAAVDVIALEVERISEAQRFTARLLAERDGAKIPSPARASEPRAITPH